MKSRWFPIGFPNVSGMAYIMSQVVYIYIISYIHHIHHIAILHQLGWQEFINQFLIKFAHVLKLSNHEYMDGGIALPTLSQANSRNIQSSHIFRFTWKYLQIIINHHQWFSKLDLRYPTDIQSSSDRGRLPLPLRHRALWQGALGTGADGPGGGAPGHARQVPWLQWRRQKPWGKIDGENHGKIRKSMETWKKNYRQSEKPWEIDWNWGHSGFNCYLWCFLVGNRRRGWDAAMVHIWFICWSSCSMIPVPFGAWHVFPQLRLEQSFPQARLWVFRTAHLLLLVRLAVEPSCSDRFSKRQEMWNLPKVVRSWLVLEDTGVSFKLRVENSNPNIPSHKGIQIPL